MHLLRGEEKIKETEKGRYTISISTSNTFEGIIDFNQSGNAYVSIDGVDEDIFIHMKNVKDALQGDRVLILLHHYKGKKLEGSVLEVLERKRTELWVPMNA